MKASALWVSLMAVGTTLLFISFTGFSAPGNVFWFYFYFWYVQVFVSLLIKKEKIHFTAKRCHGRYFLSLYWGLLDVFELSVSRKYIDHVHACQRTSQINSSSYSLQKQKVEFAC